MNALGRREYSIFETKRNHRCVDSVGTSDHRSKPERLFLRAPGNREQRPISCRPFTRDNSFGDDRGGSPFSHPFSRVMSACGLAAVLLLFGCDLVPSKPDAVFVLYRDRMKSEKLNDARKLLSEESRVLSAKLTQDFELKEPPENLALLNVLDPVTPPVVTQSEPTSVLLQVRTLKGGVRLVRLVRSKRDSPWTIDLTQELDALNKFLSTRRALDNVREQAGEFASSWRAFSDQLGRMRVTEPPPQQKPRTEVKAVVKDDRKTTVKRAGRKPHVSAKGKKPLNRRTVNRNSKSR